MEYHLALQKKGNSNTCYNVETWMKLVYIMHKKKIYNSTYMRYLKQSNLQKQKVQ